MQQPASRAAGPQARDAEDAREQVRIERWAPGARVTLDVPGGAEVFVLDGGFRERDDTLRARSWLRSPAGSRIEADAGARGARVWIKTGHLEHVVGTS